MSKHVELPDDDPFGCLCDICNQEAIDRAFAERESLRERMRGSRSAIIPLSQYVALRALLDAAAVAQGALDSYLVGESGEEFVAPYRAAREAAEALDSAVRTCKATGLESRRRVAVGANEMSTPSGWASGQCGGDSTVPAALQPDGTCVEHGVALIGPHEGDKWCPVCDEARRLRGGHNGEAVAFMQAEKPRPNLPVASSAKPAAREDEGRPGRDEPSTEAVVPSQSSSPARCAHKRCWRKPTQAFDVGSWWTAELDDRSNLKHYEVCGKHAAYFAGPFDSDASDRVQRDLREWGTG